MSVCLLASVFNGLQEASIILFPGGRGRPILQLWTHVSTVGGGGGDTRHTVLPLAAQLGGTEDDGSHQASVFQLFAGRAEGGMDISSVQRLYDTRMRIAAPESEVFICWGGLLLLIIIF